MRIILLALIVLLFAGCVLPRPDPLVLVYEFRVPATQTSDPLTKFDLFTERGATGTRLRLAQQRSEGDCTIFAGDFLIFPEERRRAMIVSWNEERSVSHVFVISKMKSFAPTEWSQWRKPDYLSDESAGWAFMHGAKPEAPPKTTHDIFEFRYRIRKRNEN